jgi:hypothetical protein
MEQILLPTSTMFDHARILNALLAHFPPKRVFWLQYGTQEKQEEAKPGTEKGKARKNG